MSKHLNWIITCLVSLGILILPACSTRKGDLAILNAEWRWQSWQTPQDVRPTMVYNPDQYTLTLSPDKTVAIKADCNSVGGEFKLSGRIITFSNLFITEMYCTDASLDTTFVQMLSRVTTYRIEDGWLVLTLDDGQTVMRFSQ